MSLQVSPPPPSREREVQMNDDQATRDLERRPQQPGAVGFPTSEGDSKYQPLDNGLGFTPPRRRKTWLCCDSQGWLFNSTVGVVILINALVLAFEADLGVLGGSRPDWKGLDEDMSLLSLNGSARQAVTSEVKVGLAADKKANAILEQRLNNNLHEDVDLTSSADLPKGAPESSAAYNVAEFFFVSFFTIELLLRFCDLGLRAYCRDSWIYLDLTCVVAGLLDMMLPLLGYTKPATLTLLRVMRVLRILRLFRVFNELKVLAQPFVDAFSVVARSGVIVVIINFVCAVALTSIVGQKAYLWGAQADDVDAWFGSVGRSMQTLFTVMTLSGWDNIAVVLAEVIPGMIITPCFVLYIMLCTFAVVGLIAGAISDSFMAKAKADEKDMLRDRMKGHAELLPQLTNVLASCDQNKNGCLSRDELAHALDAAPDIMEKLKALEIDTTIDEILQLYDRLSQDSASDGSVKVGTLAEAIISIAGPANASGVFDLKYLLLALRRESGDRVAELGRAFTEGQKEASIVTQTAAQEVVTVSKRMSQVQQEVAAVSKEFVALSAKLGAIQQAQELEKRERTEAIAAVSKKLDVVTAQFAAHSALSTKVDGLASRMELVTDLAPMISACREQMLRTQTDQAAMQEKTTAQLNSVLALLSTKIDPVETSSTSSTKAPSMRPTEPEQTTSEYPPSEFTSSEPEKVIRPSELEVEAVLPPTGASTAAGPPSTAAADQRLDDSFDPFKMVSSGGGGAQAGSEASGFKSWSPPARPSTAKTEVGGEALAGLGTVSLAPDPMTSTASPNVLGREPSVDVDPLLASDLPADEIFAQLAAASAAAQGGSPK